MKRIDDKIDEIKSSQQRNRILFIAFVVLIMAFMAMVIKYESQIEEQNAKLEEQNAKLDEKNKELDQTIEQLEQANKDLAETNDALTKSLRPEEYWDLVQDENTARAYILYLTEELGIERENEEQAIENLKKPGITKNEGWLYVGNLSGENYNPRYADVVWRLEHDEEIKGTVPQVNDIVEVKGGSNRSTYRRSNLSSRNSAGWRAGTKALVTDVRQDGVETKIKIIYY